MPPKHTPDAMEEAFDRVQALEWGFAPLVVLHAAAQTGLLSWLAEGGEPCTAAEAAAELDLHPAATDKVLRALVGMDLADVDGDRYRLRPGAEPLFDSGSEMDHTGGLTHLFHLSQRWADELPGWLRTGETKPRMRSREGTAAFVGAMRSMAHGMVNRLSDALALEGARDLTDVGGALGTFSLELCLRHPHLRATVLDLPEVIELTRDEIARYELEDRVSTVVGSYLEVTPPEADVVLLANVLHQEGADDAAAMVRRAAEAVRPGGRVAIVDFTVENDRCHPLSGALFAINMRLFGDAYSEAELRRWLESSGLQDVTRTNLSDSKFLITARKPPASS